MLINLTNHPAESWPEHQKQLARMLFDNVVDLPFPAIDPNADEKEIGKLAEELVSQCFILLPESGNHAVHVMGEMTLTFAVVNHLKKNGITCIASTTSRVASINDNIKTTEFHFVRFREYVACNEIGYSSDKKMSS